MAKTGLAALTTGQIEVPLYIEKYLTNNRTGGRFGQNGRFCLDFARRWGAPKRVELDPRYVDVIIRL
jgi:hypothetical protein